MGMKEIVNNIMGAGGWDIRRRRMMTTVKG